MGNFLIVSLLHSVRDIYTHTYIQPTLFYLVSFKNHFNTILTSMPSCLFRFPLQNSVCICFLYVCHVQPSLPPRFESLEYYLLSRTYHADTQECNFLCPHYFLPLRPKLVPKHPTACGIPIMQEMKSHTHVQQEAKLWFCHLSASGCKQKQNSYFSVQIKTNTYDKSQECMHNLQCLSAYSFGTVSFSFH